MNATLTRRAFLQAGSALGAGLLLGFRFTGREGRKLADVPADLNGWIRIAPDERVTLTIAESEMGQGVYTSLSMILADELDADWSRVRYRPAPVDPRLYGDQVTGGSTSVRGDYAGLREAGAAGREMLVQAAAKHWGVEPSSCRTKEGEVLHPPSGRHASYGSLADAAARLPRPRKPRLKEPADFRFIGRPMKRLDTPVKVTGRAVYGIDVRIPGLLVAQVVHCPIFGGRLASFDAKKARAVPGVRGVVRIPSGVAVVAEHFWAAQRGREALEVSWEAQGHGELSTATIDALLGKLVQEKGLVARDDGDALAAVAKAARRVEAVYELPYLAHACLEPMNCTADVRAGGCEIWVPTQAPTRVQKLAAGRLGLDRDRVKVHTTFLGGGFGRRAADDFVLDALHMSKAVGKPVKVIWTREDDMRGGYYRPAAANHLVGALDGNGWPVAWSHAIASPSIRETSGRLQPGAIDHTAVEGARNLPYDIPNLRVTWAPAELPIPTWYWRSVGSSLNAWVTECFLDELAAAGGKDPLALRLKLLGDRERHERVLRTAAGKAGWGRPLPAGHARGLAVHACFGSFVAQVAEVSREEDRVRVHKVVCAVDCGGVVNPDTIAAQMESGIVFGLSAALYQHVTLEKGRAVQGNYDGYPLLRMSGMPEIETHIVTSGDALGGIGEPGTPPIAPAVCNALLRLTGRPVRRLPIEPPAQA